MSARIRSATFGQATLHSLSFSTKTARITRYGMLAQTHGVECALREFRILSPRSRITSVKIRTEDKSRYANENLKTKALVRRVTRMSLSTLVYETNAKPSSWKAESSHGNPNWAPPAAVAKSMLFFSGGAGFAIWCQMAPGGGDVRHAGPCCSCRSARRARSSERHRRPISFPAAVAAAAAAAAAEHWTTWRTQNASPRSGCRRVASRRRAGKGSCPAATPGLPSDGRQKLATSRSGKAENCRYRRLSGREGARKLPVLQRRVRLCLGTFLIAS
jgi:hypothetical protein